MRREPSRGTAAAVLGYPENGPYAAAPARLGETQETISEDSYGRGPIRRPIVSLRGSVRSGNSGGPLVDDGGRVLGTVFAATNIGARRRFRRPQRDRTVRPWERRNAVDTGPCTG